MPRSFKTYILLLENGLYYTGCTGNLKRRMKEHGKIRKLLYYESYGTRQEALDRERQIKGWSRAKKEALMAGDVPSLKALSKRRSPHP